ncbi:MAG TPA: hypothetical protein VE173_00015 [Longimicrobiales bacterium]|nr:hypothetical protein [Longimicrobiales bacterium]
MTLTVAALALCLPWATEVQNSALVGSFRPYLFVLLAFGAGWLLIGAWVFRIGRKVEALARRMGEAEPEGSRDVRE